MAFHCWRNVFLTLVLAIWHVQPSLGLVSLAPLTGSCIERVGRTGTRTSTTRRSHGEEAEDVMFLASPRSESSTSEEVDALASTIEQVVAANPSLGLTEEECDKVLKLCQLVVEWNERINLVSRKDCTLTTVWERHVLPSLAGLPVLRETVGQSANALSLVDVGTGGGFPGLPLAIALPEAQFCLLDSVGKKLTAVKDMSDRLGLSNVEVYHGRAEALERKFNVATGRSVAALPSFCAWMHHLLEPKDGHLLYWIGGDIEEAVSSRTMQDHAVADLVPELDGSDKRVLVLGAKGVKELARKSGVSLSGPPKPSKKSRPVAKTSSRKGNGKPRGAWDRKQDDQPKQRGYEGFQRYDSTKSSSQ